MENEEKLGILLIILILFNTLTWGIRFGYWVYTGHWT